MKKATFDPKGVTATLINRVQRTGLSMMRSIENAHDKSIRVPPKTVEDIEADFLLANVELEWMLKSQLAKNADASWRLFVDSVSKLQGTEKQIFRGVVRSVKQAANNIMDGKSDPFDTKAFALPPYILPYAPIQPAGIDQDVWKTVLSDAEKLEASAKDVATNLVDAAALVTGAAAAAAEAPVAAGVAAFAAGWHIGQAINEHMGWQ